MSPLFDSRDCPPRAVRGLTFQLLNDCLRSKRCNPESRLEDEIDSDCPSCQRRTLEVTLLEPSHSATEWDVLSGVWWRCGGGCTESDRLEALEDVRRGLAYQLEERLYLDARERPMSDAKRRLLKGEKKQHLAPASGPSPMVTVHESPAETPPPSVVVLIDGRPTS